MKPGELYELFEGEELRLECFASGIPRPQISWKHDGKLLANKEDFLVIREVEKNNSGDYQCDARNVGGNITAKTTVAVKGKKRLPELNCIEKKPRWKAVRRIFLERKMLTAKNG